MGGEQRLGKKTFWLLVLSNSTAGFVFLLIAIILLAAQIYASNLAGFLNYLLAAAIFLFIISFLSDLGFSWLTYINYTFVLDENYFKVKHGIFYKEETAIPYRQIQSIDLRQDFLGQLIGYSRIVILTAGHDEQDEQGEAEAIFPVLDTIVAKNLQAELLKRSETERVTIQK